MVFLYFNVKIFPIQNISFLCYFSFGIAQYEKLCLTKGDHYSKWCGTGGMHREEKCSTEHVNKQCRCLFKAVQYFVNHKIYFFVLFPNVRVSFCIK